jgi:hypothetical protein
VCAAVKTEAPCPGDIHTLAGVVFKYEIMRMPADVEPTFVYVGACAPAAPGS